MNFIAFILLGLIAGWIAGKLVQGRGYGLVLNMIVGMIGAFLGGSLFNYIGIGGNGFLFELAAAVLGAIILIALVRMVKRL